jgi:4-amino-4-deoxy-L-arabinose transferase-like glycosyltransferase
MVDQDSTPDANKRLGTRLIWGVALLLVVLAAELALSARQQSQTFDEAAHIFAGYRYWKNFDFGINPEHPPLIKLVAAIPLLRLPLRTPPVPNTVFKVMEYDGGRDFLYENDANSLLWRARLAAAVFTVALALAIFLIAKSMKGEGAAFLALVLFIFEPNFLAHGALVTTDVGAALGLFLGVGSFYLYLKQPSLLRLAGAGLAAGLCLGAKHSGILLLPVLLALAVTEMFPLWDPAAKRFTPGLAKKGLHLAGALVAITTLAWIVLWSLYGFRYAARPAALSVNPTLTEFARQMQLGHSDALLKIAQWHLLPESYLYGVANIYAQGALPTVLFGKYYSEAQWFYFPAIFLVKSTLAFLVLCLLAPFCAALWGKSLRREILFLVVPAAIYLAVAMNSGFNYGVRHLLPVYPFLIVLIGIGAWELSRRHRALAWAVAALVLFHAASSLRAFPDYIPYSNRLWGGSQNTFRILADSNVDWGQGLMEVKAYLEERNIKDCWLAYFASVAVDVSYYGIPCRPLPTSYTELKGWPAPVIPAEVDGPVLISATEIAGVYWRADWANPYLPFRKRAPSAVIAGSILVYEGKVDLSQVSALTHEKASMKLLADHQLEQALAEAETAVEIAPDRPIAHATRSMILSAIGRKPEAGTELNKARAMASAILAEREKAGTMKFTLSGFRWQSK